MSTVRCTPPLYSRPPAHSTGSAALAHEASQRVSIDSWDRGSDYESRRLSNDNQDTQRTQDTPQPPDLTEAITSSCKNKINAIRYATDADKAGKAIDAFKDEIAEYIPGGNGAGRRISPGCLERGAALIEFTKPEVLSSVAEFPALLPKAYRVIGRQTVPAQFSNRWTRSNWLAKSNYQIPKILRSIDYEAEKEIVASEARLEVVRNLLAFIVSNPETPMDAEASLRWLLKANIQLLVGNGYLEQCRGLCIRARDTMSEKVNNLGPTSKDRIHILATEETMRQLVTLTPMSTMSQERILPAPAPRENRGRRIAEGDDWPLPAPPYTP